MKSEAPMHVVIAGAGGMGCRFAAALHDAGHRVSLLDGWSDHVEAIGRDGLEITDEAGRRRLPLAIYALSDSAVIEGAIDLVIVFGKATQTAAIVDACAEVLQRTSYVATLQNGLGNIEEIQRHVPADVTLLGVTTLSAELLGPGKIQALGSGTTQLGPLTPAGAGGATRTVTALQDAGLPTDYTPLPLVKVWTKVAFNCALNALCTVARVPVGSLAKYDDIQPLVWSIADEVVAVAGATGVQVDPTVLAASFDEAFDDTGRGSAHHIPSMLQDLLAGRRTEIDHLNAAVVRLGGAYGVETPVNDTLAQLVRLAEATMSAGVTSLAMPV